MHRLKGSSLEYYNVQFGEGPWPEKAYYDAEELARKRSASQPINYGFSRPGTVAVGTDPTMEFDPYGGTITDETIVDDGYVEEEIMLDDSQLQPLEQIEEIEPRKIENIPPPKKKEEPPMGKTTQKPSAGSILRASYIESQKPELKAEQVRWHELGLDHETKAAPKTKAKLRSVN